MMKTLAPGPPAQPTISNLQSSSKELLLLSSPRQSGLEKPVCKSTKSSMMKAASLMPSAKSSRISSSLVLSKSVSTDQAQSCRDVEVMLGKKGMETKPLIKQMGKTEKSLLKCLGLPQEKELWLYNRLHQACDNKDDIEQGVPK